MRKNIKTVLLDFMMEQGYSALEIDDFCRIFGRGSVDKKAIKRVLGELEIEGKIFRTNKGKYGVVNKAGLLNGTLRMNQRGFGFVTVDEQDDDIFIPKNNVGDALDGDKVVIKVIKSERTESKQEGIIVAVVQRENLMVVGEYEESRNFGFVVPDNRKITKDIYISEKNKNIAKKGDIVLCEIIKFSKNKNPEGKILDILGSKNDSNVQLDSIIIQHGIISEFPKKVLRQTDRVPSEIISEDMVGRLDLRNEITFTIDDITAMDLDDAISIDQLDGGGYKLGVHIADVSHYVKEDSALDKEALRRGTSVYLVDRVIPMLPKKLSNGICSLNPEVDRLTLSCIMYFNSGGSLTNFEIKNSIIRSYKKLNYTDVSDLLEGFDHPFDKDKILKEKLILAGKLAEVLENNRRIRGEIEFNFPESKITMVDGIVTDVNKVKSRTANKLIESFMLVANETVAEAYENLKLPFVYRIHEYPDIERMETLGKFLGTFGLSLEYKGDQIEPIVLQKVMEAINGKDYEIAVSTAMLRSLKQAKYSHICKGHYGLAARYYCHFTSPIRRYPDLQIHRIIKDNLAGNLTDSKIKNYESIVESVSESSSKQERKAEEVERAVDDLRKTQYMKNFIGEKYEGVITSVTNFGMFVELDNSIEGLVRINELTDDFYIHDKENYRLIGEITNKQYRIGDKVKVKVTKVDVGNKEIDFDLD
ncbi:MAG: ribonuclease R [Filifactoraceae bacterium]